MPALRAASVARQGFSSWLGVAKMPSRTGKVADASVEEVAAGAELEKVVVCCLPRNLLEDANCLRIVARLRRVEGNLRSSKHS